MSKISTSLCWQRTGSYYISMYFSSSFQKLLVFFKFHITQTKYARHMQGCLPCSSLKQQYVSLAWTVITFFKCLHVFIVKTITSHQKTLKHAHPGVKLIALKISSNHDTTDTENCFQQYIRHTKLFYFITFHMSFLQTGGVKMKKNRLKFPSTLLVLAMC